ncbi:CrcB family protein [Actinomycetospora lutea]|uniref:fluoride efflux transporter FluC n=1 Tax=Actinomycetospora lutea TaxID=663604 RepID=UPI0023660854|nr:CrcB family protein [Actinomycetospora lutea]MDD7938105.1 CrcB family protein [Actinomycetospora lutea]
MIDREPPDPDADPDAEDVVAGRPPGAAVLRGQGRAVAAVAAGGVLGSLARWAVGVLLPTAPGGFPWATVGINVLGSLLMGVLVVVITEVRAAHPLVRPFLGTGVLGGFTTFSTFAVDAQTLLGSGHRATALASLGVTILGAVGACALAMAVTRRVAR